ncbi:MAG: anti-sigma factor, partial [Candidatus Dormibacteraeota bacterium]|nr:anti-sigma factor [Candidatus Dormibacteraeota bacterium]
YSLGAVSESEAASVRGHLPECSECQATLLRMAEVVAVLPLSLEEVAPPEGLRERLLAEAEGGAARPVLTASLGNDDPPAPQRGRLLFLRQPSRWAPVAAAAMLIVGLVGWNVSLQNHPRPPGPAPSTIQATLLDASRSGVGSVTYLKEQHIALVSFHALSSPMPDKNYELWVIPRGGKPQPAGVFLPEPDGTKVLVLNRAIAHGDTIAVTQEAPGGVPQPTGLVEITASI